MSNENVPTRRKQQKDTNTRARGMHQEYNKLNI